MVLPTANISASSITQSLYPSSFGMDLQALNLLASAGLGRTMSQPSQDSMALFREDLAYSFGQLQEPPQTQVSTTPHKVSCTLAVTCILLLSNTCMNNNSILLKEILEHWKNSKWQYNYVFMHATSSVEHQNVSKILPIYWLAQYYKMLSLLNLLS